MTLTTFLNTTVVQHFGFPKLFPDGWQGVEIEMEGSRVTQTVFGPNWRLENDGSLRGESIEAVFATPMPLELAIPTVEKLYSDLKENKGKIFDSMRAGVHVHLNVQGHTLQELLTLVASYYVFEELITRFAGEEREGNLFCLRLIDAEDTTFGIKEMLKERSLGVRTFGNQTFRYSALNLTSLGKFGTLEFRALRTPVTAEPVVFWMRLINQLFVGAKNFRSPRQLLEATSADGEEEVAKKIFGPFAEQIIKLPGFKNSVYRAVRIIQDWVYLTTWNEGNK